MAEVPYKKLIVSGITRETSEVKIFYFEGNTNTDIYYKAGQYLTLLFGHGELEARRSYSIAASPVINEPLSIGVKRIPNGKFSRMLFDLTKPGDVFLSLGAGGVFTLPEDMQSYKQIFFFAAGSGIIPIYSLIKTLLYSHPHIEVVLIYSNSSIEKTVFYRALNELKYVFTKNLQLEYLFSNAGDLMKAHLHGDLIEQYLQLFSTDHYDKSLYYVCGPESYMRLCIFTLHRLNIPANLIKKEIFHVVKPALKLEPPDKSSHRVLIIYNHQRHTLEVQYPLTILQVAKNNGIVLPYSCEVGKCGNCMATCTKGTIWMSYNEVLTEKELSRGLILTCTAYPIGGDAVVTFDENENHPISQSAIVE
jgi:ring-1,2-phenylacetyl-CoA epoxidase subunit PaaE